MLPKHTDLRGSLYVVDFVKDLPFEAKRSFLVTDVPQEKIRGEHAHHKCHQFLVAIKGSLSVIIDDGANKEEVLLSNPDKGLWLKPKVWGVQFNFSKDAALQVYASDAYDPQDYIHNYTDFLQATQHNRSV